MPRFLIPAPPQRQFSTLPFLWALPGPKACKEHKACKGPRAFRGRRAIPGPPDLPGHKARRDLRGKREASVILVRKAPRGRRAFRA